MMQYSPVAQKIERFLVVSNWKYLSSWSLAKRFHPTVDSFGGAKNGSMELRGRFLLGDVLMKN